jgi:hypothetical protein
MSGRAAENVSESRHQTDDVTAHPSQAHRSKATSDSFIAARGGKSAENTLFFDMQRFGCCVASRRGESGQGNDHSRGCNRGRPGTCEVDRAQEPLNRRVEGSNSMKKCPTEFIEPFFLVSPIGCAVIGHGAGALAPFAVGSALTVMIFAGGHISDRRCGCGLRCRDPEAGSGCFVAPADNRASARRRVSVYVCARVRRAQHCHRTGYFMKLFFLWAGYPVHAARRSLFSG